MVAPVVTPRIVVLSAFLPLACAPAKPPSWEQGGTPLAIPNARWDRPDEDPVELHADGRVLEDGTLRYVVDRVGRIVDEDYESVAILLPDGRLVGNDNVFLGQLGVTNASSPHSTAAWLAVRPDGSVIYYDDDGEQLSRGKWTGCNGPSLRTCTLVTQVMTLRDYARRAESGVTVGVGVGVGF